MDYILKPTLEHVALTKIAVTLWNQHLVKAPISMDHYMIPYAMSREWLDAEEKVIENVSGLLLPEILKGKVVKFICGIGQEILNWRNCHAKTFCTDEILPSELCWAPHGTVDKKKTAETFLQIKNLDITSRYRLACDYCLEDDIPKLWDKIPENLREQFVREFERDRLVVYWTYLLNGKVDELRGSIGSPYQYAFKYAARHGHKEAAEYFLQRTCEEREALLGRSGRYLVSQVSCCYNSHSADILCFLFSQMNEREQIEAFKNCPSSTLRYLLEWPWQSMFMETANRMWDFLPGVHFKFILEEILQKRGRKDCDYQKLFVEFWQQSPNTHKKYVIDRGETLSYLFLYELFCEGKETVRLILKSATDERKKEILFSYPGKAVCSSLFEERKWDSLKLLLQECLSSKEVMIQFKEEFQKIFVENGWQVRVWNEFIGSLLNEFNEDNSSKRCAEEAGESTSAKRLRSSESEMKKIDVEE